MSCRNALPVQEYYTAAELAEMAKSFGIPEVPSSDRRARDFLSKSCDGRKRQGSKATEYAFASLPQVTQDAIINLSLSNAGTGAEALEPSPETTEPERQPLKYEDLNDDQLSVMSARVAFVREIQRLSKVTSPVSYTHLTLPTN